MTDNRTAPRLSHLTIKPIHQCAHHCPYCDSRQALFRKSDDEVLGLEDWARVFWQADALGTDYLDISGGEPSLYKPLPGLIWEAKRHGWFVSLNSTGTRIVDLLGTLEAVCLDQIIVSLISLDAGQHDGVRHTPGSWKDAVAAIDALRASPIRLVLHFIVNRHNYREVPDLIDQAFEWQANGVSFVYPENDHKSLGLLMSDDEIEEFRADIVPEATRRYVRHRPDSERSLANLRGLYAAHGGEGDFTAGIFWRDLAQSHAACDKPDNFALIYANGDVFPCNAVEYSHEPIVGNALRESMADIWLGQQYDEFRKRRMTFCQYCPINRHTGIGITTLDNPPYAAPVVKQVPDQLPRDRPDVSSFHLHSRKRHRRSASAE